jgi:type I restriction-modification system DNA methylase subunit
MLSIAEEHRTAMNPKARLTMYGQEANPESFAICKADMLIKGRTSATSSSATSPTTCFKAPKKPRLSSVVRVTRGLC